MEEPKLNEEELKGLSEEERAKKIAEIEKQRELYWKERYKQNFYEFGDGEVDYSVVTPDVAEAFIVTQSPFPPLFQCHTSK